MTTTIGPARAQIMAAQCEIDPWSWGPAAPEAIGAVIAAAEKAEADEARLLARPDVVAAIANLLAAGVTPEQYEAATERETEA